MWARVFRSVRHDSGRGMAKQSASWQQGCKERIHRNQDEMQPRRSHQWHFLPLRPSPTIPHPPPSNANSDPIWRWAHLFVRSESQDLKQCHHQPAGTELSLCLPFLIPVTLGKNQLFCLNSDYQYTDPETLLCARGVAHHTPIPW